MGTGVQIGGVDEAGRGCVLGPLAVAGVSIDSSKVGELKELGVRDSKQLSPEQRESLYVEILDLCTRVKVSYAQPPEIDRYVRRGRKYRRLNFLEARHMAKVIDGLEVERVFVDAPDTNPGRFATELSALLSSSRMTAVVAEHKADVNYPIVSAASIVAKVERDRSVEELRKVHGEFGSGYPSDPETIAYLTAWVEKYSALPEFSRRSWKTWDRILLRTLD